MNNLLKTLLCGVLLLGGTSFAADSEKKVKMKDLPAAVQAAVKEQSKGATIKGLAKEVEDGKTLYEMELKTAAGTSKDITFDADGKVVSLEEQVNLSAIPAPARAAIEKAVGKGKISLVETVTTKGTTYYEAQYKAGGKSAEVKVDAAGQPVK